MDLHQTNNLKAMKFALFSILLLLVMMLCDASRSNMGKQNNIGGQKTSFVRSKRIPLRSIKSPDGGDIIDCIHISHQPAFDHPLLKNHTILTSPSYYPEGLFSCHTKQITQLWQLKGSCPEGTIPIRKTEKEDLFRANSVKKQPRSLFSQSSSSPHAEPDGPQDLHDHAVAVVQDKKYHGAKATINVWQPQVQNDPEFSLAQIWVLAGPYSDVNTVEAGWHVHPSLNGDNRTRLFIFWTSDGYRSRGCYNLFCPGFVQTSREIAIGSIISPVSSYHGPQYVMTLTIWKDSVQNAWWISYGNVTLGYWPATLFTYLADSASAVEWGGEVFDTKPDGQHSGTQMGSGHFAEEGMGGASYFRNLQVIDESNNLSPPGDEIRTMTDRPGCYNIALDRDDVLGDYFLFGGPGRNPDCE